ncbi:hypothetical protein RND81_14G127200 [Saponaria officinalis]|uniref:Pectinesterase inhibitor domain-containing protein n=1 Tax=Saponaria officinalis TaxID=3572 RepID=A0AAW1GQ41_SAPOF
MQYFFIIFFTCVIISNFSQVFGSLYCNPTRTFIKRECNSTYFANLCYTLLAPHACTIRINRQVLCETALQTTMNTTQNVLKMLVKLSKEDGIRANKTEASIISGCVSDIIDVIDNLNIASINLKNKLVNKSILRAIKAQVMAYIKYSIEDDKRCFKRLSKGFVRDYLKKKIYYAFSPSIKLKAITLSLVSRI